MKRLALCHCLNRSLAITLSLLAFLLTVLLAVLCAGSFSGVARQDPFFRCFLFLHCPVLVFLGVYLFGHRLDSRKFWIDQVCVNQHDAGMKSEALQAIPAFVAQSNQMLIIWDDEYFHRLWCNYELAIRAKASSAPQAMEFVPVWLPIFILSTIVLFTLTSTSLVGQSWSARVTLESGRLSYVINTVVNSLPTSGAYGFVAGFPGWLLCLRKLQKHKLMLHQMKHFDFRDANCTLENDRKVIGEQVQDLFDEALEPPIQVAFGVDDVDAMDAPLVSRETFEDIRHITSYPTQDEVISQFNEYVRGPLRESLQATIGKEEDLPLNSCIATVMPLIFGGFAIVLGCDGMVDCERAASNQGYPSVTAYRLTNAFFDGVLNPCIWVLFAPLALRSTSLVRNYFPEGLWQILMGGVLVGLVGFLLIMYMTFQISLVCVVVIFDFSPIWLAACATSFVAELWAMWFLFFKNPVSSSARCLATSSIQDAG